MNGKHGSDPMQNEGTFSCPNCGRAVTGDQRFCGHCGHTLQLTCSNCGTKNPLSHRFCSNCGTVLSASRPAPTPAASVRDERRWVTVMFADISDFTAMSEKMDPEDVMTLASRAAEKMDNEVRRFGGTVLRTIGDEVLAVFGAPTAHEDDAERAVQAALAIRDLDLSGAADQPVRVHVGINTGEVLAGFISLEGRHDYEVMGDVVNTAARLRSAAPAGSVWVGRETYLASMRVARFQSLLPLDARGKGVPIEVWEVLDVVAQPEARPFGTVSLVGRDQELDRLLNMWSWAADNRQPHLVTILGEAGLGKSRLVAEFEQRLPGAVTVLHGTCLSYGAALSYGALEMMLKEAAGITAEDAVETARAMLAELVKDVVEPVSGEDDPNEIAQHLALMCGLDVEADRLSSSPDGRVFRVSARRFLAALAKRSPLCLIFDNIHWADAALLDLIEHVAANVQEAPLLLVTQSRPELLENRPTWGRGVRSFTSLVLQPLDAQSEQELILALCREHGLPEEIAAQMSRTAGGNPLFAEELVAMVSEQGEEAGIPLAIKLLISARLDTLPLEERRTLQVASIFGGIFWRGGLQSLVVQDITAQLEALTQKGLLRTNARSKYPGEQEYVFKHDLICEVAYEMLPRAERRLLHGQLVDWLEQTPKEHIEAFYDLMAHHAVEADQHERAITYLVLAAERAGRATAHRQEAALLDEAILIASRLKKSAVLANLHTKLGEAFIDLGKWTEAEGELGAALAALGPEETEQRVKVLSSLSWTRFWLADVSGQREAASQAMALAESIDRDELVAKAMFAVGFSHMNEQKFQEARDLCRRALKKGGNAPIMELTMAAGTSGLISFWKGEFDEAIEYERKAVEIGRDQYHAVPTAISLPQLGLALASVGRYDEAEEYFSQAKKFGQEYELWPFLARSMAMSAGYHLDLFDYIEHERIASETRELGRSLEFPAPTFSASIDLLLNFARRQEIEKYEALADEVVEFVETAHGFHGWLWRLRLAEAQAESALARGDWEEAIRWAELGIARSQAFGRPKYNILSLESRAKALSGLGRSIDAIKDLRNAVEMARSLGDPAITLRVAQSLLATEGDDALLAEVQDIIQRIIPALPGERMRRQFVEAEPVQHMAKLTR